MIDPTKEWLPIGSIVRLEGGERLVMVAGYMSLDGATGRAWDYVGYPYPEGKQGAEDHFFDRANIVGVYQLGLQDAEGLAFMQHLEGFEESYQDERARRAGE